MDSIMLMASLTAVSIFGVLLFATKNCWSKKVNFAIGNVITEKEYEKKRREILDQL